ncbi:hypothetical protein [Weissella muntiaci]|uniref:hypothetical protein n=1 Tax=Weissella muntiaci TaxID=2508881 RepID=UPI0016527A48|nr:hypothetical protein [Weissella muntiaci]
MPLSLQGFIGTAIIIGGFFAWMVLVAITDDFIDRFKQFRKTQKNALAAATTNAQRK